MRKSLFLLPLLLSASPALAQQAPQLPRELTDPATAARLAGTVHALTYALLNMRVGEIQAAVEGRQATPEERNLTVGDIARREYVAAGIRTGPDRPVVRQSPRQIHISV